MDRAARDLMDSETSIKILSLVVIDDNRDVNCLLITDFFTRCRGDALDHERIVLHRVESSVYVKITPDSDIHRRRQESRRRHRRRVSDNVKSRHSMLRQHDDIPTVEKS